MVPAGRPDFRGALCYNGYLCFWVPGGSLFVPQSAFSIPGSNSEHISTPILSQLDNDFHHFLEKFTATTRAETLRQMLSRVLKAPSQGALVQPFSKSPVSARRSTRRSDTKRCRNQLNLNSTATSIYVLRQHRSPARFFGSERYRKRRCSRNFGF